MKSISGLTDNQTSVKDVNTGEVRTATGTISLVTSPLGSCIAVIACDMQKAAGGIAHIMLPGKAPSASGQESLRYAENAIEELVSGMRTFGTVPSDMIVCIAGGGNVLKRPDDTVCRMNIESTLRILKEKGLSVHASSVGGTARRRVRLDVAARRIFCSEGDGPEKILWLHNG